MKSNILILKLEKDMTEKLNIQWQEGYISEKHIYVQTLEVVSLKKYRGRCLFEVGNVAKSGDLNFCSTLNKC